MAELKKQTEFKLYKRDSVFFDQNTAPVNIAYAKVTLDISGADRTVVQALEWELYDYNDIRIDNPAVRSKVKTVQATLPVKTSKEVDLVVNFVPAAGSTLDTMQYTVSPDKVTLVGEK